MRFEIVKEMDSKNHERYTGSDNICILKNIKIIKRIIQQDKLDTRLWIRTQLIPGETLNDFNIVKIGEFIRDELNELVDEWDLCAFNPLCSEKYLKLGKQWDYSKKDLLDKCIFEHVESIAANTGLKNIKINVCGFTKNDE